MVTYLKLFKMKNEEQKTDNQQDNGVLPCVSGSVLSFADWIEVNKIPVLGHCKRNIKTYYLYNESIYNTDELFDEYRSCTDR